MSAWEFVKNLKAGWNLGDTMDGVKRGEAASPSEQEVAWGNPKTTFEMIKLVKDTGFDIFRLPVTWFPQTGPEPDYVIKPEMLNRVQEIVDYGIDNGLTVILNMHHENWHFPSEENYETASQRIKAMWTQIATYFAEYDNRLVFEVMNEPRKVRTPAEWNEGDAEGRKIVSLLNKDAVNAIRQTNGNNAKRMIMIPSYAASCTAGAMEDVIVPDDENIIVSIHAYMPYPFALSGDLTINHWSPNNPKDTAPIDEVLERMQRYFLQRNIPVILGECGARDKSGNYESRLAWAKYFSGKFREYGVPTIWWDNGRFINEGEGFGLMDRKNISWKYPELVDAFLGK